MSSTTRSQHRHRATEQQRQERRQQDRERRRIARQHESDTRRSQRLADLRDRAAERHTQESPRARYSLPISISFHIEYIANIGIIIA